MPTHKRERTRDAEFLYSKLDGRYYGEIFCTDFYYVLKCIGLARVAELSVYM